MLCEPLHKRPKYARIELAAAVSPRAQLIVSVGKDRTHNFATSGFGFIKHFYGLAGSADLIENVHLAEEGHDFGPSKRQAVYAFFAKHLAMNLFPEDLRKITIESPEQMQVFDDEHPLPPHALEGSRAIAEAFARLAHPGNQRQK